MGSQSPKMAFLAVLGALKIAYRAGRYAGWRCIWTIYDLRRPEYHLVQLKKSVKRNFCSHILIYSRFRVRHDAVVFRPNRRHEQNRNGLKPLKPGSFGIWGPPTKKVEAKKLNQEPAKWPINAKCQMADICIYKYIIINPLWPIDSGN